MSNKTRKGIRPVFLVAALGMVAMLAILATVVLPAGSAQAQDNPFLPVAPTGVVASAADDGSQVTVAWGAGARSAGYEVERKVGSGDYVGVSPAHAGTATTYTDTDVSAGMTYTYRVRGTNAFGSSSWAESNAVTVDEPEPTPPSDDPDKVTSSSTSASSNVKLTLDIAELPIPS